MENCLQLIIMLAMVGGFWGFMLLLLRADRLDTRTAQQRHRYEDDEEDEFWDTIAYLDLLDDDDDW